MLQVKQTESLLSLQQRHVGELSLVKLQSLRVCIPLAWLSVDDKDARDLWQLSKDDLVVILNHAHNTVCEQISVSLVLLTLMES